ncbi:MAG TPA: tetratricopeptide repeat protein [Candidatus Nitrosopolaris rasttigaisensis]|nr:tetratricopeptide repeat protein [Candidatus Nitrosopolaris rasttigaisensis]
MIKGNGPLTICISMPGTEQSIGGQSVPWPDPEAIERNFFEKIALKLKRDLHKEVILHIEKDKHLAGDIRDPMSAEVWQAPVYIADLTGNNANIYLELGIRWALKDSVTVLVSQTVTDVKFDAAYAYVIPYSNDPAFLKQAIEEVVKTIKDGLADEKHTDSPVRSKSNIIATSKYEIRAYQDEIRLLEDKIETLTRSQEFLDIAKSTEDPEQRMFLYQNAIRVNPALIEAYLPLVEEQRKHGQYNEALVTLRQAIALFPANAAFYRERGLIYSKSGQFKEAIEAFRTTVTLNSKDDQAWGCLGGLLRRIGTKSMPYNWDALREARDSFQKALEVNDRNTYVQGNLARLDLLLSKIEPNRLSLFLEELDILEALCRLDLKKDPENYWRWFDRADCYLLSGKVGEAYCLYTKAVELVPKEYRKSELSTVVSPLTSLLLGDVLLDNVVKVAVQKVVNDLQAFMLE